MENMRDLGGLPVAEGRRILPGLLFRACERDEEEAALRAFGVRRRLDLRSPFERQRHPCREMEGIALEALCGETGGARLAPMKPGLIAQRGAPGEELTARYAAFPKTHRDAFRRFFEVLLSDCQPTQYFCCQGKDRTGVFTAAFLKAVGASDETVYEDYLRSNEYRAEVNRRDFAIMGAGMTESEKAVLWSYMEARAEYMQAFLHAVRDFDVFWQETLGFSKEERAKLIAMYTEEPE